MSGNNPINNDQLGEFAVEAVRSAWKSNRKIIPIIGAGMSAESGVPPLDPIKHYLGGLAALVSQGDLVSSSGAPDAYSLVSSGTRNTHVGQVSNLFRKSYSENFRCFIQECGWPSRQSVEQETNRRTHLSGLKQRDRDTEATLDQLTRQIQPWLCEQLARKTSNPKINPSSVLLDWRELVQHLTEYQQDLTDALFTSIHRGRTPGAYLGSFALLVKLVGIETIFTFNFDRLIETALWNEGLSPTVFGMELGKSLPTPALSTAPCVIKMHGSTHNLLVDQQLDHPLTPDYTKRFLDLSGAYPLYVLAGLSGADRRLQDLITAASEEFGENAEMRGEPLFVWITSHRSKLPSDTFSAFSKVKAMQYVETPFPSLFFHELYLRLTDRIPNHRLGHRLKLCKPLSRLALQGDGGLPQKLLLSGSSEGLQFSDLEGCILVDSTSASVGSPDEIAAPDLPSLLRLLPDLGFRRHIIHLDLEELHSLGSVLSEFIDRVIRIDESAIPSLIPVAAESPELLHHVFIDPVKAAGTIRRYLRRNKITLVLDGLDAFDWRATSHHGITAWGGQGQPTQMSSLSKSHVFRNNIFDFFTVLCGNADGLGIGDSSVIATVEDPVPRHTANPFECDAVKKCQQDLQQKLKGLSAVPVRRVTPIFDDRRLQQMSKQSFIDLSSAGDVPGAHDSSLGRFIQLLCTVRRTRPIPLVRFLFHCSFYSGDSSDKNFDSTLKLLYKNHYAYQLEGGFLGISRSTRNAIYDRATTGSSSVEIVKALVDRKDHEIEATGGALWNLVFLHAHCAHWYYNHGFTASRDPLAFLEFIYHRISSLRYLCNLRICVKRLRDPSIDSRLFSAIRADLPKLQFIERCLGGARTGGEVGEFIDDMNQASDASARIEIEDFREAEDLMSYVDLIASDWLSRLASRWLDHEAFIRNSLAPQRVLCWAEAIVNHDAEHNLSIPARARRLGNVLDQIRDHRRQNSSEDRRSGGDGSWSSKDVTNAKEFLSELESGEDHTLDRENEIIQSITRAVSTTEARALYECGDFFLLAYRRICVVLSEIPAISGDESAEPHAFAIESRIEVATCKLRKVNNWLLQALGLTDKKSEDGSVEIEAENDLGQILLDNKVDHAQLYLRLFNYLLDVCIALHWWTTTSSETGPDRKNASRLEGEYETLSKILHVTFGPGCSSRRDLVSNWPEIREVFLRFHYWECEKELVHYSQIGLRLERILSTHESFRLNVSSGSSGGSSTASLPTWSIENVRDSVLQLANRNLELAFQAMSDESAFVGSGASNPFLNPGLSGSIVSPYRALLRCAFARVHAASAFRTSLFSSDRQERYDGVEEIFRRAYADLDNARNNAGPRNRAILAMCDYFAAETAFVHSRCERLRDCRLHKSGRIVGNAERSKLRSVENYLTAADEHLRNGGGRHAIIWRSVLSLRVRSRVQQLWILLEDAADATLADQSDSDAVFRQRRPHLVKFAAALHQCLCGFRDAVEQCPTGAEKFEESLLDSWCSVIGVSACCHELIPFDSPIVESGQNSGGRVSQAKIARDTNESVKKSFWQLFREMCLSASFQPVREDYWSILAGRFKDELMKPGNPDNRKKFLDFRARIEMGELLVDVDEHYSGLAKQI